jgi:PadR family transcriptional regulator, regulatory protein PadR
LSFVERLKDKIQKENLWFFLLVLLAKKPRYGYELRKLVRDEFGFWSGNVTAYRVLYNLENGGLVRSVAGDRRKYYTITDKGRKEVGLAREFIAEILSTSETKS